MKTLTPQQAVLEEDLCAPSKEEMSNIGMSLEIPIQQMFDEFFVFISKNCIE